MALATTAVDGVSTPLDLERARELASVLATEAEDVAHLVEARRAAGEPAGGGEGAFRESQMLSEYCADEFAPFPGADRYGFDRVRPPPGGWWGTRVRLDPSGRLRRGVNPTLRLDDTTFRVVKRIS